MYLFFKWDFRISRTDAESLNFMDFLPRTIRNSTPSKSYVRNRVVGGGDSNGE